MRLLTTRVIACLIVAPLVAHAPAGIARAGGGHASLDRVRLAADIGRIAAAARPGVLGVGVAVLGTNERWLLERDRPLPMQSVFKAPLGAAVLDAVDRGRLRLDSTVVLRASDLSVPYSPVAAAYPSRTRWTLEELLTRAVETSDNTAADVLMRLIGGPAALTSWLRTRGIEGIEVDRYERVQQPEILGLGRFQPSWVNQDSLDRAKLAVPEPARRAAMMAYLRGRRDTITPRGAVAFLAALQAGRLVSKPSTTRLLHMMTEAVTGPHRLRAGLPNGATLAHKTGTGPTVLGVCTATNDIGIATLPDGRRVAIAVLLSGSTADEAARDATLAAVARAAMAALPVARATGRSRGGRQT
ncbi:MAG TPA: class A beta-lactamase [Gemmatimonadales bacterium]|nr:class A beta-lactamase [Gemmatimonadales bacterium]